MPRKPRLHVPGGYYHVTLRGNSRRDIFIDESDRIVWQSIMSEALKTYQHRIHAYCLMTNHVHMAVQTGQLALGRFVCALACRYAKTFNKKYSRSGHLFERRHGAILVQNDSHLLELIRYIHQNPVRANMVNALSEYPWSSHNAYTGADKSPILTTQFVLSLFGSGLHNSRQHYLAFMGEQPTPSTLERLRANQCCIDSTWIKPNGKNVFEYETPAFTSETLEQLIVRHCKVHQRSVAELQSASRTRSLSRLRAVIALEATDKGLITVTDLARHFKRSQPALSRAINRLRRETNKL